SQILRWLKSIGDEVIENEPLIEIETDKVTVEVAAPGSGTLREIVKQEQEEIAPGDLLGTIEATAADAADARVKAYGAASATPAAAASPGTSGDAVARDAPVSGASAGEAYAARENPQTLQGANGSASHLLSPAVRRLLAERGLDPSDVRGT